MKSPLLPGLFALLLFSAPSHAQSAGEAAIDTARKELEATSREYQGMRTALYREINTLDDEVIKLF